MHISMMYRPDIIRKGESSVDKKKMTWRQAFKLYGRGLAITRKLCPNWFCIMLLRKAAETLTPYVGIYLSARIIDELAGLHRAEVLWPLIWTALGITAIFGLLVAGLKHWDFVMQDRTYLRHQSIFSEKLLSMDYEDTDNAEIRSMLRQIEENRNWGNYGLITARNTTYRLASGAFGILGAVVLTMSLFTSRVPSGPLAVLNYPVFVMLFVAALIAVTLLGPACKPLWSQLPRKLQTATASAPSFPVWVASRTEQGISECTNRKKLPAIMLSRTKPINPAAVWQEEPRDHWGFGPGWVAASAAF